MTDSLPPPPPHTGKREVFFEMNGVPRVCEVIDRAAEQVRKCGGAELRRKHEMWR